MKNKSNIIGTILLILALLCIAMYFVYNSRSSAYSVTFDSNGGSSVLAQTVNKGEKVTKPADPTKESNDFVEWQLNGVAYNFNNPVTSNITLKAIWKEYKSYKVTATLDSKEYTANIRENELVTADALKIPAKTGYKVVYTYADGKEYDAKAPVTADLTLNAKYVELAKYTVKFDSNGGTKVSDVTVVEGETVSAPTVSREGYKLDGWYLDDVKYDFKTPVEKNITLKAKWNDGETYTVTFTVDDATYKTSPVKENTKVSKPTNPTKKGYKFIEWRLNGKAFDFNIKITENITLIAYFEESKTYTVSFNSDGGSTVKPQEVTSKATKPTDPTRAGYKFVEWQLNGKTYNFNSEVVEDITLKAIWQKVYTVTFDSNGGSSVPSQQVPEGQKATKPTDPTKSGYVFVEWLYNRITFDFTTQITQNITLVAYYKEAYTVTFNTNGGSSINSQTVIAGEEATRPSNPTKDGSTFVRWELNGVEYGFNQNVTANITLNAIWEDNGINNPDIVPSEDDK